MRIGLLECDHVRERYRPIDGDYVDMFRRMVREVDPGVELVVYDARGGTLASGPHECDAWMLTGSSASVYDDEPWIDELTGFVRDLHRTAAPTVGICFGHQLLAHALGGRTERAATGWGVGAVPMSVTAPEAWMDPPLTAATLLYSHQDQVTALPPGGRVLATAPHCPVAMLAVGHDAIGVQAHPEFRADYVRALLDDRVDRIGEARTAEAIASLAVPTDERTVAGWLLGFLHRRVAVRG